MSGLGRRNVRSTLPLAGRGLRRVARLKVSEVGKTFKVSEVLWTAGVGERSRASAALSTWYDGGLRGGSPELLSSGRFIVEDQLGKGEVVLGTLTV